MKHECSHSCCLPECDISLSQSFSVIQGSKADVGVMLDSMDKTKSPTGLFSRCSGAFIRRDLLAPQFDNMLMHTVAQSPHLPSKFISA